MTRDHGRAFPMVATLVMVALLVVVATPARADAAVLETMAIVSAVIVGTIVIVYLVIANVRGSRAGRVERWVACAAADSPCWGAIQAVRLEAAAMLPPEAVEAP